MIFSLIMNLYTLRLCNKICEDFDIEPSVYLFYVTLLTFHYKVLNDIVASGDNLFKWKIKDSEKCQYCNEKDTLLHCLWECPKSKDWLENCLVYVSNENESYKIDSMIEYL